MDSTRRAAEMEVRKLASEDGAARARAAKALGRLGEAAAPQAAAALARCLEDPEENVRLQGARALGKMGPAVGRQAAGALAHGLADADAGVRAAAARALGWMGDTAGQGCVEALADRLADGDAKVRATAAGALGHLGEEAACTAAEPLAARLHDEDAGVRAAAAGALVPHVEAVAAALLRRLDFLDAGARRRALEAIGHMGVVAQPRAEEGVVRLCLDPDAGVREAAFRTLELLRSSAEEPAEGIEPTVEPLPRSSERPEAVAAGAATAVRRPDKAVRHATEVEVLPASSCCKVAPPVLPRAIGQRRHAEAGALPRLLGTPTPRTWEKPQFFPPPGGVSESDSGDEAAAVRQDAITA